MDAPMPHPVPTNEGLSSPRLSQLLSGIEAGIVGGIAMLALLVVSSLLRRHVWWETPNLLGSTFYGSRAFRSGPGMATVSGAALHLVITGSVGAIFGVACGSLAATGQRRHLVLLGVVTGVVWYFLAEAVFWKQVNPLVPLYSSQGAAILAHALFGACLGYIGQGYIGQGDVGQGQTVQGRMGQGDIGQPPVPRDLPPGGGPPPLPHLDR